MTDKQINVTIAEICGWTDVSDDGVTGKAPGEICNRVMFLPLYCTNLNAMHEAEKVLGNRLGAYGELLCEMTVVSERDFAECYIWHATARQRAEAFLRTLGKWEEVQG